jgi:hypothetical protein
VFSIFIHLAAPCTLVFLFAANGGNAFTIFIVSMLTVTMLFTIAPPRMRAVMRQLFRVAPHERFRLQRNRQFNNTDDEGMRSVWRALQFTQYVE